MRCGELQVNPNEAATAPSPGRAAGEWLLMGVFQGMFSPATPLGKVTSNDGEAHNVSVVVSS